ncbi:MAG: hypothetical protein JF595_09885 [Sphingomonadales bacterium]|nr:hypothetical protein [Sphingomonadales bacterium]
MNRDSEQKSADRLAFEYYLRTGRRLTASEWLAEERKFNPYHDPDDGRFTFTPDGSAARGSSASMASRQANGGKPYPARIDLRNGAKPYPVRVDAPVARPQRTGVKPAAQKISAPPAIRFDSCPGLDLSAQVIVKANSLSDSIQATTQYRIMVTSGRRGADRQAEAMYDNYADKTSKRYADVSAERDVKRAFDQGRNAGKGRDEIIDDMAEVLKAQVSRGVYISRHMRSGAIDIRTPPARVLQAIRNHPSVQSVLVENDHIHIQFH